MEACLVIGTLLSDPCARTRRLRRRTTQVTTFEGLQNTRVLQFRFNQHALCYVMLVLHVTVDTQVGGGPENFGFCHYVRIVLLLVLHFSAFLTENFRFASRSFQRKFCLFLLFLALVSWAFDVPAPRRQRDVKRFARGGDRCLPLHLGKEIAATESGFPKRHSHAAAVCALAGATLRVSQRIPSAQPREPHRSDRQSHANKVLQRHSARSCFILVFRSKFLFPTRDSSAAETKSKGTFGALSESIGLELRKLAGSEVGDSTGAIALRFRCSFSAVLPKILARCLPARCRWVCATSTG